ncbi:hypothetical protein EUX98_g2187 [Antrodiella citrinella]|uniref:Uncharacterized protein n=1 Tax=Antrodiella citrinella TaxID=2447956 RepID=A0A4S4N2H8_9APHY|nr:hypothetical protein EUX98_g2187 [Antrodiella citrinella]
MQVDNIVAHSLRVVNLWDPDFGDFSQIAFDKLVVTSLNPNGDVIGNTSTPSPGGILNPPLNAPSNDSASPISVSPPSTSNTQAGDPLQTVNSPASTPQAGNPAQTANAPASTPQIGGPFQTINPPASDTQVGGPIQTVNAPASNTIPVQTSNTVQYPNTSALPVSQSLPPVASSTAQYPNTSVLPVSGPTQTPSQTSNTAQYPNTSAIPDPKAATTLSLAATTPTAPPRSATVNQVNNNSPTTVTVAAPTIASPPTETIVVPSVVGNAGSSATPSEALSKALLAMMVLLLIVFLSCLVFGIFTLYMQTRARRRNRANIEDGMSSLGAHITPYVIASPTSANRDSYNRHSYTAAYHGGDPHIPSPITIPHPPYDRSSMSTSPSVRSLTPMAELRHLKST